MKHIAYIAFLFLTAVVSAQNADRQIQSTQYFEDRLELVMTDGFYIIKPYSDNIIETSFIPKGEEYNPQSHAVVMQPEKVKLKFKDKKDKITFATKGVEVVIEKSPFRISYYYGDKLLLSEKEGYVKKDSTEVLQFNLSTEEALYGGGARALGMNRRGNRLQLYNRAHYGYGDRSELLNFTMPLVLSSKIYAVHFDNAPIGWLDLDSKKDNTLEYETISGRKTYQVVAADNWYKLMESYTQLTGRQPMPPRWTLGNFASRFGYHSEKQVREVVQKFREEKIPLDAIVLDLYWFGKEIKGTMGNLEFYKDSFPTPEKMIADLKEQDVKTVLITEPFILTTSNRWQEAVDNNVLATNENGKPYTYEFYFGTTGIVDLWKPDARKWFWNIYKNYINMGVAGWWGDLGEPEVHPSYVQHAGGLSADEVHNIYGNEWAKLVAEGYKKDFPKQRPFILMRAGYSGTQRYGMIPWSGDVDRSWEGLQSQPEIAMQMGMQGVSYMHSDLGGFAGYNDDDELYARWLQYGVFQPVFRPHAQDTLASEPIYRSPKAKALAKKAIELRYRMLPYNYTMAFKNNYRGYPLMRPLFFEEPNNKQLFTVADEYLWGDDILVAPILQKGIKQRKVYFPKGSNWFYDNKMYEGGSTVMVDTKEDFIPFFFRGGSFVPYVADDIQSTERYAAAKLEVEYYYDPDVKESWGILYEDDGKTANAYEKGMYQIFHFKSKVKKNKVIITIDSEVGYGYSKKDREVMFSVITNGVDYKKSVVIKARETAKIEFELQ
ncbi:alpha-glucosidase [Flavobacterium suaedae]|uniref:Alpha-glucosidase n=1 Tax=Flavobacterium suaedae TaxID=1767027 RepID=A0ABQ1K3Q4_9FLAO|nr:TIM-barrel domain-containing protein [Flavobacterium suaedae]GGB85737.1 alpha-glucosidase [Flavobacterium suaedae]